MLKEEARIVAREEKMGNEDQALTVHTKRTRMDHHHSRGKHSHSVAPATISQNSKKFWGPPLLQVSEFFS